MKIIELFPKKMIELEDDECLNCYAYIDETEVFCSDDCRHEWHFINQIDETE
jgi:hypothetical protein